MADYWISWTEKYPIISIEDGMAENDWDRLEIYHRQSWQKNPTGRR